MKRVKVDKYSRVIKGRKFIVKRHLRSARPLGKNIRYRNIGRFLVAHDNNGNFRGSKVIVDKKKTSIPKSKPLKIKVKRKRERSNLTNKYLNGKMSVEDYLIELKKEQGLL